MNATTGGAMTPEQQENWARLLDAVDGFLSYPAEETALEDVARAHAVSEVELERDSQLFGEIPPQLAERVLDRVSRLSERLVEVRRLHPPPRPEEEERRGFAWPIDPVIVTSLFGERLHPIHRTWRTHAGLDLRAYPGQQVSAAASGTVVHAGWNGAHGIQVQLEHEDGLTTRYSHLSAALVEEGAKVERGDPVGLAGRSGTATGVHLHFEVWRDGKALDPLETLADAEPAPANEKGAASSRRRPSSAER